MAKKTVIQDRVKIRGIRKRWLVNSMGVVTLILLLAMGTLTLSCGRTMRGPCGTTSPPGPLTRPGASASTPGGSTGRQPGLCSKFPDKQKLEVQFIETDGSLLCTSYGLDHLGHDAGDAGHHRRMESGDVKPWTGQDPQTGERSWPCPPRSSTRGPQWA